MTETISPAPRVVTADVYDLVVSQRDGLAKKLADVTAELDNVAPSKVKLLDTMRALMDETLNYKQQADDFEYQAETLDHENSELRCRNQELVEELDKLRSAPVPKLAP